MSQTFTEDCFAVFHAGLTDLQNMENNFLALKTLFSGSSAPANSTGGMPWFDTGKKILKLRNSTNGAWLGLMSATTAPRFWVYAHNAEDGWVVETTVSDRVIAIKGGSQAYNATGGTLQGSWTISGTTVVGSTHNHKWYGVGSALSDDYGFDASGNGYAITIFSSKAGGIGISASTGDVVGTDLYTANNIHAHSLTHDATWRPAAAVGTLQYLDL
jgi:hypothetical protein